ncbi:MAG: shikimate kinase [Kiritimatiellia bacterium]
MNRNIILVGFMGTGKTAVGNLLASRLGMEFLDMDQVIVDRQGKPVSRIFSEDGEAYFRALERDLVRELSRSSGLVIGAGGGIVLDPDNIEDFSREGLVVCLRARPEAILKRLDGDTTRPLLADGDKLGKIRSIINTRSALYDEIPLQIDTTELSIDQVADRILEFYNGNNA